MEKRPSVDIPLMSSFHMKPFGEMPESERTITDVLEFGSLNPLGLKVGMDVKCVLDGNEIWGRITDVREDRHTAIYDLPDGTTFEQHTTYEVEEVTEL